MRDSLEDFIVSIIATIILGAAVLALGFAIYWAGDYTCRVKAEAQSMQYKFGPVMGCLVKYKGQWVDYDRLRYTGD